MKKMTIVWSFFSGINRNPAGLSKPCKVVDGGQGIFVHVPQPRKLERSPWESISKWRMNILRYPEYLIFVGSVSLIPIYSNVSHVFFFPSSTCRNSVLAKLLEHTPISQEKGGKTLDCSEKHSEDHFWGLVGQWACDTNMLMR